MSTDTAIGVIPEGLANWEHVEGVDYSFDHPSPAGLVAVGKAFAGRYVGPGGGAKMLLHDEAVALSNAPLSIVSLVEGVEDGALGGHSTGVEHAKMAVEWHRSHLMPAPPAYYFAVDFDVTAGEWPAVADYLRGAASIVGLAKVGVYGGYKAMMWAERDRVVTWRFQTYAWSDGQWWPGNHIEQYRNGVSLVGGTVDLDRARLPSYGQWRMGEPPMTTPGPGAADIAKAVWAYKISSPSMGKPPTPAADWIKGGVAADATVKDATFGNEALLAAVQATQPDVDITALFVQVGDLVTQVKALLAAPPTEPSESSPVDPVALATAIAANQDLVTALGAAVAAHLGTLTGEITLGGSLSGRVGAAPAG